MTIKIDKPWGWYQVIYSSDQYIIKILRIKAGKRISLQSHKHRDEFWTVVMGSGIYENSGLGISNKYRLKAGSMVGVYKNEKHRLTASEDSDIEIVEVQKGDYLSEDDITRYQDDFGRIT
jgi:mannose-6-phosphate isomerase-like protein (cupin superfamily)